MIKVTNLNFTYGFRKKKVIFKDFNLELPQGSIYGLLGENGVGKSTLLYLLSGLLTPDKGNITFDGTNVRKRLPSTLSHTFIVPEEITLPDTRLNNYIKITAGFYPRFSQEGMKRNLEMFEIEPDLPLGSLSMGQKKKVYMSFALATNPLFLLMDEPTNGLDIPGKSHFRKVIASNMTDDSTIIISTHQVKDIDLLLDHVVIMDNDTVLLDKSIAEISEHLSFVNTDSKELLEKAIYSQPSLQGNNLILPNDDGTSVSQVNLESLFNWVVRNRPQDITKIFNSKNYDNE